MEVMDQRLLAARARKVYSNNIAQDRAYQHVGDVYGEVHVHVHQAVGAEWLQISQASGLQTTGLPNGILVPRRIVKRRTRSGSQHWTARIKAIWIPRLCILTLQRSYGAWNLNIQIFRRVRMNSKIFKLCQAGDLPGVRKILASGQASALDVRELDIHGNGVLWTDFPFHVAMRNHHTELCRFLLDFTGLSKDMYPGLSTWIALYRPAPHDLARAKKAQTILRILVEDFGLDCDDLLSPTYFLPPFWEHCNDQECFRVMQNAVPTPYADLAPDVRFHNVIAEEHRPLRNVYRRFFDAFKTAWGSEFPFEQAAFLEDARGNSALHLVRYTDLLRREDWLRFFSDCILAGADIHHLNRRKETPLLALCSTGHDGPDAIEDARQSLRNWLELLWDNNVDLLAYGETETVVLASRKESGCSSPVGGLIFDITGLRYGPKPECWDFDLSLYRRRLLWRPAVRDVPGQWPEEYAKSRLTLPWYPNLHDRANLHPEVRSLGEWECSTRKLLIRSMTGQQYTALLDHAYLSCSLKLNCQDDHGFISRQVTRDEMIKSRSIPGRRRAVSEPIPSAVIDDSERVYRSRNSTHTRSEKQQKRRARLFSCHRCALDGMWRQGLYNPVKCLQQECGFTTSARDDITDDLLGVYGLFLKHGELSFSMYGYECGCDHSEFCICD